MTSPVLFVGDGISEAFPVNSGVIVIKPDIGEFTVDGLATGYLNAAATKTEHYTYSVTFLPGFLYSVQVPNIAGRVQENITLFDPTDNSVYYSYSYAASQAAVASYSRLLRFDSPETLSLSISNKVDYSQGSFRVNIYSYVESPRVATSGTEAADMLIDTYGSMIINALGGNDFITPGFGWDIVDGGMGTDTVSYGAIRSNYIVTPTKTGLTVAAKAGTDGTDTLTNVERLKFADASLAFDIAGNGGQAYRIYQAAFARMPDKGGLGFWMSYMDQGHSLAEVSTLFLQSAEFITRYGAGLTNDQFVRHLYSNVLHREPDYLGYLSWMDTLNLGKQSRAEVLIGFSESAENKAALIGVMQKGMEFIAVE